MAVPDRQSKSSIAKTTQEIQNWSYDELYNVLASVALAEYNGSLYRLQSDASGNLKTLSVLTGGDFTWKDITQYGDGLTSGIAAVGIEYFNGQDYQRTQAMQVKVDKGTTDIIYIGKSKPGTGLASALWQITKVDKTVADNVTIKQADAGLFTATWNDRATETYS